MQLQAEHNTKPELAIRRLLFASGLRYRVHRRPVSGLRREADIAFVHDRLAVFIDGCFWHGCEIHGSWPKANAAFWRRKIERNISRDAATKIALEEAGWIVLRIWEHEKPSVAADRIAGILLELRSIGRVAQTHSTEAV